MSRCDTKASFASKDGDASPPTATRSRSQNSNSLTIGAVRGSCQMEDSELREAIDEAREEAGHGATGGANPSDLPALAD